MEFITNTMPITRSYFLLPLITLLLPASLSAQVDVRSREDYAERAFTLDSVLAGHGSDYYIPTPVSSPDLRATIDHIPLLSKQLLAFLRAGGRNPYQTGAAFVAPSLLARPTQAQWLNARKQLSSYLEVPRPSLKPLPAHRNRWDSLPSYLSPGFERMQIGALLLQNLAGQLQSADLTQVDAPVTGLIALATPSGASAEELLTSYSRVSPVKDLDLSKQRDLGLLRQRHWIPSLESTIQFSQNQVSDNWYKGGASNLNLYMRNYFSLRYVTDRVEWTNEIESKLSIYNADKDTVHRYRIADDLLRLRSNYGLRAWDKIYYTIDAELRTQIFNTYRENSRSLQSDFLSPYTINVGLGAKFDYSKKSTKVYGRSTSFSINVAPLSYTYRATRHSAIDLARHGLTEDKLWYQRIGSTVRANLTWKINLNLTWASRLYFNTSYKTVEAEWENTLDMALTRFFSTRLNLNLRYDDAVAPAPGWRKYLQYNELLSFGFNYKF